MLDRRSNIRGRVYYGARIAFNNRRSTMDCVVRNLARGGAQLALTHPDMLSEECDLTIPWKGVAFRARMIWRRDGLAGFAFRNPREVPMAMTLDWAMRLRATERANKTLRQRVENLSGAVH